MDQGQAEAARILWQELWRLELQDSRGPCRGCCSAIDTWVAFEDGNLFKRGDIGAQDPNPLPPGHVLLGAPVSFDVQGVRRKEFSVAVSAMNGDPFEGGGLQLNGPSSALKLLKDMRDQQITPSTYHEHWVRSSEVPRGDRSIYEHEVLSRILDSMIMVDQLDAPALQSAELVFRRLQVIRQAHKASSGNRDYSSADHYMGWKYKKGAAGVDSDLSAFVANELKSEAAILKEARKAKEEQEARHRTVASPEEDAAGRRRHGSIMAQAGACLLAAAFPLYSRGQLHDSTG